MEEAEAAERKEAFRRRVVEEARRRMLAEHAAVLVRVRHTHGTARVV
jgi:hypothetical protein